MRLAIAGCAGAAMTTGICSWCGHPAHGHPCPRTITTGSGKTKTETDCPCTKEQP